jgi:hypothetical protein
MWQWEYRKDTPWGFAVTNSYKAHTHSHHNQLPSTEYGANVLLPWILKSLFQTEATITFPAPGIKILSYIFSTYRPLPNHFRRHAGFLTTRNPVKTSRRSLLFRSNKPRVLGLGYGRSQRTVSSITKTFRAIAKEKLSIRLATPVCPYWTTPGSLVQLSWHFHETSRSKDAVQNNVLQELERQFLCLVRSLLTISKEPSGSLYIYRISWEEVQKPKEMISELILNKIKYYFKRVPCMHSYEVMITITDWV